MVQTVDPEMHENEKARPNKEAAAKQEFHQKFHPLSIIGEAKRMAEVYSAVKLVSRTHTPVMLRGEIGTDKDLIASAIHNASTRAGGPFVKFSFSSLSDNELEMELFGYERPFIETVETRRGILETANNGTLFFDDIEKMTAHIQAKLLQILSRREYQKLGSGRWIPLDVRLITSTSSDLEEEVEAGRFREDLYYRLNAVPIFLPSIRQCKQDLSWLIDRFIQTFNKENKKNIKHISDNALEYLMNYSWPGNIPELENVLERACVLCTTDTLTLDLFPDLGEKSPFEGANAFVSNGNSYPKKVIKSGRLSEAVQELEKQMIEEALEKTGWIQRRASQLLGITERRLGYKLKRYGLKNKF